MISKVSLLFLTLSILNSCGTLRIPDALICTTPGVLEAGANCTRAVTGVQTQLTFEELIDMLEPSEDRGPAVIIPLNDFVDIKTELEKACVYMICTKKQKQSKKKIIDNINKLINNSL